MSIFLEDIKLSIGLEEKGYDFYTKTAERTSNPLAKATLSSLAERELIHLERIKEFYKTITGDKTFSESWLKHIFVAPKKEELLKPILERLKSHLNEKNFKTKQDINEAYKIAEGLETDSFNLYDKIAKESSDDTAKKFYSALAIEEREHYAILDETLLYLNDPGEWFKRQERWIVEG